MTTVEGLKEKLNRWDLELTRLHSGGKWGESRRYAGRSAGNRLQRIEWLYSHIGEITQKIRKLEEVKGETGL